MTEYVTKDTIYVLLLKAFSAKHPCRHFVRSRTCFFFLCVVLALLFTIQRCGFVLKSHDRAFSGSKKGFEIVFRTALYNEIIITWNVLYSFSFDFSPMKIERRLFSSKFLPPKMMGIN